MAKVKGLTVQLGNRPGTLAYMAKVLADEKMNVPALLGTALGAQESLQVVMDKADKAKKALILAEVLYTEGALEEFEVAHAPGTLARLTEKVASKGINIDRIYATVHKRAKKAITVFSTSKAGGVTGEEEPVKTADNPVDEKDGYAEGPVG
jgi:hypothetical protein